MTTMSPLMEGITMAKFETHKRTVSGKAETMERKAIRRSKHTKSGAQSLKDVATMVNARYVA